MALCEIRSSRLLITTARPPAVFFVFVKPRRTQKPMKSASTKTVLDASPSRVPIAICSASPIAARHLPPAGLPLAKRVQDVVVHEAAPNFFHRHALGLVQRLRTVL